MRSIEKVKRELTLQWLKKSTNDFSLCEHLIADELSPFCDAIAFHAQQSAEKCLKAYLTWNQVEFPKSHDMDLLLDLISKVNDDLATILRDTAILSDYSVEIRYPSGSSEIDIYEARQAVIHAKNVRDKILDSLPEELKIN